jgi:hypothetical protein
VDIGVSEDFCEGQGIGPLGSILGNVVLLFIDGRVVGFLATVSVVGEPEGTMLGNLDIFGLLSGFELISKDDGDLDDKYSGTAVDTTVGITVKGLFE